MVQTPIGSGERGMNGIRVLIVEDDERDLDTCRSTVERYQLETGRRVELYECRDVEEAFSMLDDTFDGVVIDLTLNRDGDAGNRVIKRIEEEFFRIPVAVLTGTPDAVYQDFPYIGVFKKGEAGSGYEDLLKRFWRIHNTGLTRILGGKGIIESKLTEVFRRNILVQIEKWEKYGETEPARTEKALLRHTLNHLIQLIDEDMEPYFPEEFYLYPPPSEKVRTGSILKAKGSDQRFAVMSPDCDLVIRANGSRNTDRILLVEVVSPRELFNWFGCDAPSALGSDRRDSFVRALGNNGPRHYHCLPETDFFPLGFLNFRSVSTLGVNEICGKFDWPPKVQISPPFVKDIVARFSSFYARQGQPDIDFADLIGS